MLDWDKVQKKYKLDLNFLQRKTKINRIGFEEFVNDNLPNLPNIVQETTSERDSLVAFHQSYFCPAAACLNEAFGGGCLSTIDSLVSSKGSLSDDFNINSVALSEQRPNKKLQLLYDQTKEVIEVNWPRLQNDKKYVIESARRCRAAAPQIPILLGKRGRHYRDIKDEKYFIESHKLSKMIKPVTNFSELISAYSDNCDGRYISLMEHSLTCYKNICNQPTSQLPPLDNSIRYFPPPVPVTYIHPACWGKNNRRSYDSQNIEMIHPASMSSKEVSTNISYRSKYYIDITSPRPSRSNELNAADGIEDWDDLNIALIQATAELHLIQAANYCKLRKLLSILEIAEGPGKQDLRKRKNSLILNLANTANPSEDEDKAYGHLIGKNGHYTHLLGALRVTQIPHGNFINTLQMGDVVDALLPVTRVPITSLRNNIYMKKDDNLLSIEKKWCISIVVEILEDKPIKPGRGGIESGTDEEHSSPTSGCSSSLPVDRRIRRYIKVRISPTDPAFTEDTMTHNAHWIGVEDQCLAPPYTYTKQQIGNISTANNNSNISNSNNDDDNNNNSNISL